MGKRECVIRGIQNNLANELVCNILGVLPKIKIRDNKMPMFDALYHSQCIQGIFIYFGAYSNQIAFTEDVSFIVVLPRN